MLLVPHSYLLALIYKGQMLLSVNTDNSLVTVASSVHVDGNLKVPES